MSSEAISYSNKEMTNFITALEGLTDSRDNRGKRHNLCGCFGNIGNIHWTFYDV